ncbi:MAG TPA: FAD-dependent oxidoreductase [Dehalococcoidia bacterium]|nr:FAD-dependent oxidoreductase [Dehalococcoidia bacterium]
MEKASRGKVALEKITLNIDGREVVTEKGKTVLEAALGAGIYIPNLCHHPDLKPVGACRLCIVEIDGMRGLPTACTTAAAEGMVVRTLTPKVDKIRRFAMELTLAAHPSDCLVCPSNLNCQLQAVAQYIGVNEQRLRTHPREIPLNSGNPLFENDLDKCILCGRCVRACHELRGVGVLSFINRGKDTYIGTAFDRSLADANCRFCGACIEVCPTGALRDKDGILETGKSRDAALVPCRNTCPAGIDIPRYIHFVHKKKYAEALAVIREKVPFPRVLGYVCDHPCEGVCRRGEVNEAISIKNLKRFATEKGGGAWKDKAKVARPSGKKVAVVGSGPAGLTVAYYLSNLGHAVTVFEALSKTGGMLRVGIPQYRLSDEVLDAEIDEIMQGRFEIKINTRIDSPDSLFEQGYDAVFLGIGAHKGTGMRVEGEDSPGVVDAISFLRDISLGKKVKTGNRVAVIGGGNVAIDAARSAIRMGAKEVDIIYRRTRNEMPASEEEVDGALEENVNIIFLTAPNKIWNENGTVKLQCLRMELGEPDASGRRRPEPIEGSEFTADYDTVIAAIGQITVVPDSFRVETVKGSLIKTENGDSATSRKGVFAGGDAVHGPASVVKAIAAGRRGAIAIDKYLGGRGNIDEKLAPDEEPEDWFGCQQGFACQQRQEAPCLPPQQRTGNFDMVEYTYDEETAAKEAERCLYCDLRLKISPVQFPPKKGSTKGFGQD